MQPIHDLKCDQIDCNFTTYQANALIRHRLHYHSPMVYKCTQPGCKRNQELMTKAKLRIHMNRHKSSLLNRHKQAPCTFCGLLLSSQSNLKRHLRNCKEVQETNEDNSFDKVVMPESFEIKQADKSNSREIETSDDEVNSVNGTIKLMNQRVLKFKVLDIMEVCKYCGERFSKAEMKTHIYSFKCRESYLFPEISHVENYEKIIESNVMQNTLDYPIVKSKTERRTSEDQQLFNDSAHEYHIKMEPEVEILEDEISEKFEHRNNEWDPFLMDSTDSRLQFKCRKCDFRTEKKKYLQKHVKGKHDSNPIKCPDCNKHVSKASFNKHRQMHIRAYECYICDATFATRQVKFVFKTPP